MDTVRQNWPFLVLLLHLHCASAKTFEISRPVTGLDTFKVSSSMCSGSRYRCSTFNALEQQVPSCSCSCPGPRSTFTFANNRWMCMANAQARDKFQQGCDSRTKLSGEVADNRIPTLTIGGRAQIAMRYWQWEYWKCSLDFSSSSFIGCNGSRILFPQQYYSVASQLFSLSRINVADRYVLKVSSGTPGSSFLQGKIINLSIRCGSDLVLVGITIYICLLIKIQGEETCPTYEPTISTSSIIQPLMTMYSHGSTVPRLKTSTKVFQPSSRVPSTLATPSYTNVTPKISYRTPFVAQVTTLISSDAIPAVSSGAPAPSVVTLEIFATSTTDLRTSLRTSVITPSASFSSQVASYSSRRPLSSSQSVITLVISSPALVSSPKPFSSRRTVASLTSSYPTATSYVSQTAVSDTLHTVFKSAMIASDTLASVSDTSPTVSVSTDPLKTTFANVKTTSCLGKYTKVDQTSGAVALISTSSFSTYVTSMIIKPNVPHRDNDGLERNGEQVSYLLGVITGLSVSVALLVVIVFSLMFYKRRYVKKLPATDASLVGNSVQETAVIVNLHTFSPGELDDNSERVYASLRIEPGETPICIPTHSVPLRRAADGSLQSDHTYMNIPVRHHIHGPSHI